MARSGTDLPRMQKQARNRAPLAVNLAPRVQAAEPPAKGAKPKLMRQVDLVDRVRRYNPDTDEDLLNRAYVYAMKAHGEQMRASGDPYFSHPLQVAAILTDLKLDDATIAAALLHDTIEDTETTRAEIDAKFGREIGVLVEGLTKLKKLDLVTKEAKQAENLRKLLLAITADVRVLLIKLADRLHNMRTLQHMRPEARLRVAQETIDIYAPLAGRMGMHEMREELEDIAFREINPEGYEVVSSRLNAVAERQRELISEIEEQLKRKLAERGITAAVKGRRKRTYSIWRKMERKSVGFEQLSDIFGFRVIVRDVAEVYAALGVVHTSWPVVPTRFKDYISTPKANDYRSIHTTVIGPGQQRVELQLRTVDMHEIAEYGIAAHALYKDSVSPTETLTRESRAYAWLRHTVESLSEGSNPEEFLEHTKLELFQDQVFCFTPKGMIIALPRNATPIDFAYAVHTGVGNAAVGCKINGQIAPLVSQIGNGDEVEIVTSSGQTAPPAAWESIVVTGKARAAIRRATRTAVRQQYSGLGRRIVERLFQRAKMKYSDEKLLGALPRLARASVDDVMSAVGRSELKASDVARAMYPDYKEERAAAMAARPKSDSSWFNLRRFKAVKFKVPESENSSPIPIRGINNNDLPVRFAPIGGAVPGDRIVGILNPGEGITIYPIQSPSLSEFEDAPERWLDVRWDDDGTPQRFPARLEVQSLNEPGSLAQIAQVIAENDGNIDNIRMTRRAPDFTDVAIDLTVYDLKHLTAIIGQLRAKPMVARVERVNG
jgi:RelA/SpoT family (p)ppGpp synthetase